MHDNVYSRLRAHLDVMPVAFPETESGVELHILRRFFSEEEVRVALELSMLPEPLEKIYRRLRSSWADNREAKLSHASVPSREKVENLLENLASKKVVNSADVRRRGGIKRLYGKLPFAVGIYEMQVDRLTRDFEEEAQAYMDEAFMEDFVRERPRQMRTIPIHETILPQRNVSRYDSIRELIENSRGPFALQNCICRQGRKLMGETCSQTDLEETCLAVGSAAVSVLKGGRGTKLGREETLAFLERAEKEGLVLQGQNSRDPIFICCCCSCCCAILSRVKKLPNPGELLQSPYAAVIDAKECLSCGVCIDRCPMGAITIHVEESRCIGCGLCVRSCPERAIAFTLKEGRGAEDPPSSSMSMYMRMFIGRFGPIKGTLLLAKAGLGFKV